MVDIMVAALMCGMILPCSFMLLVQIQMKRQQRALMRVTREYFTRAYWYQQRYQLEVQARAFADAEALYQRCRANEAEQQIELLQSMLAKKNERLALVAEA